MGSGASKRQAEEQRYRRYDPAVESSADEQSDCASDDLQTVKHLERRSAPTPRQRLLREAASETTFAAEEAVRALLLCRSSPCSSTEQEYHVSDNTLQVVPRLLSPEHAAEARRVFWRLGESKWRECIDAHHQQKHGRFVYDLCLHNGNNQKKELGYLSSTYDAWRWASSELGFGSGPNSWLALHWLIMQHPGNDFFHGQYRHLKQGNATKIHRKMHVSAEAVSTFNTDVPKCLASLGPPSSSDASQGIVHLRSMPGVRRKTMQRYVLQYLHDFYREVGVARVDAAAIREAVATGTAELREYHQLRSGSRGCDREDPQPPPPTVEAEEDKPKVLSVDERQALEDMELFAPPPVPERFEDGRDIPQLRPVRPPSSSSSADRKTAAVLIVPVKWACFPPDRNRVIAAAARFHRRLSKIEPSRDGNTRTAVVLVNKLLTECRLHPCLFTWPDAAATASQEEWVKEINAGLARWRDAAAGADGFREVPLPERWRPENDPTVEMGVSLPCATSPSFVRSEHTTLLRQAARATNAQLARRPWFGGDALHTELAVRRANQIDVAKGLWPADGEALWRELREHLIENDDDTRNGSTTPTAMAVRPPPRWKFEPPVAVPPFQKNAFFVS